jgi:diguanylate cyclase (GGDEF)-like protein
MSDLLANLQTQLPFLRGKARLDALNLLANRFNRRDNHQALAFAQEAHLLALKLNDKNNLAESLLQIGRAQFRLAEYEEAKKNCEEGLTRFFELINEVGQARCLLSLGNIHFHCSQYSQALESYLTALPIFKAHERKREEGMCLSNIGNVYSRSGDYATALSYYLQALDVAHMNNDTVETASVGNNIGSALQRLERREESLMYYKQALHHARLSGDKLLENTALINIGEIYVELEQYEQATSFLDEGLTLSQQLGDGYQEVRALGWLGQVYAALGDFRLARQHYEQGLKSAGATNSSEEIRLQLSLGKLLLRSNDVSTALNTLQQALEGAVRLGLQAEVYGTHELLAYAFEQSGDYKQALAHHKLYYKLRQLSQGEEQIKLIEVLLVQHEVEKTRQIAEAQLEFNQQLIESNQALERTNEELADASRRNQELLEKVQYQAQHDYLTGLPNRSLFEDRLEQTLARANRYQEIFAVMFLDLDGFKLINDTLGHDVGDELLVQVAKRFKQSLRKSDSIARVGGDEFTMIADNLTGPEDAALIARKLLETLQTAFKVREHILSVDASIGLSLYPRDGNDIVALQRNADAAMYQVKRNGKRDIRFYSAEMNAVAEEKQHKPND